MTQAPASPQWSQVCLQFMNRLQELQQSGYLCDLTFELKNHKFRAHNVVMSAWSPLIHKLLGDGSGTPETIRVHYDNADVFGSFLAFLYSCRMDGIAEQNLIQILHLATSLQVNPVRQVCEEEFKTQLKISNIIFSFHLARKYRLPNLEEYAMAYMQMNLPEAVKQADFLSLSPPRFNSFLSSGWVCVMKPEVKLFLIISWLGYDVKERQQYLVLLLKYIDWSTVANDFLNEISQTENFFTTNESSLYLLLQTLFSSLIPLGPYMDSFPALREKYAYLLDHIVQNSFVFPLEVEDYCPVAFHLLPPPPQHRPSAFSGNGTGIEAGLRNQLTEAVSSSDQVFLDYSDSMQDLSNDSVTAGIGLRMRNVAIEESQASCSHRVMLSGHAVTSHCEDRGHHAATEGDGLDFKVHLSPRSPESQSLFHAAPPSKVLDIAGRKRKGPADSKHRVSAEVKVERAAKGRVSESNKSGKTASEGSAAKSSTDGANVTGSETCDTVASRTEGERTADASTTQLNRRPKRRAAANFSVPEKLIPRLRKTKALLKEVTIVPVVERQERREASDGDSEQENSVSDSDVEEEDNRHLQEDTKKDPDFNLPRKRSRSSKVTKAAQKQQKLGAKSSDDVAVSDAVPESFSLSVKSTPCDDMTQQGAASGSDQSLASEQELDDSKAEENKSRKKACQWKRKCDQCDYSAPTQRRLDNHIDRVHGSRATVYACTMCSFECMWSKSFFEHMKHHFQGPPYVCDVEGCGWEAERIQVLLIHRRRHVDERPYKCPQCSAKFRTRNNLIAHFKCHADNKNHECPVCHRRFKMKNTMQQHLVTHSDARPYLCDTCGFSTKFQSHLISHKRIHTGEVFTCNFINCNYSSPKRSQLKAHMRSHLNIRHHTCEVCHKAFVEKSHLVRHLKIHQDERPHKCDQCEYSSTRIDKVNEHKRKYHSEEAAKNKRQYKYAPRGKNRVTKPPSKADKKFSTLPSSLTMPHAPILIPGRPIRPKKPKEIRLTAIPIKPSIEALVSAAEELGLADMVEQSGADQLNGDGRKGKGRRGLVRPDGSSGSIQLALGYNGEVIVKDEQPEESRLVMDLHDTDAGLLGTSVTVRNGKRNSGLDSKKNGSAARGWKRSGRNTNKPQIQIQISRSSNPMLHQTGYTPLPSHTSATLLQQLAVSASRQPPPPPPPPLPSALTLGVGAVLLPHTATPDVQVSSHILLTARQQHSAAAVSAADSLASLSSGFGLPAAVPTTPPLSAGGPSQAAQCPQHGVVNSQQQPLSAQPHSQAGHPLPDDCGGLTAFFHVLN